MTALPTPAAPPLAAPGAPPHLHFALHATCPPEWPTLLERCGGGFFHSPLGLLAGAPAGPPLFAELRLDGRVVGVAAGVRHQCRFSLKPRHVYFPSLPALASDGPRDLALGALIEALQQRGAVEAQFDSFDASWRPSWGAADNPERQRTEFVVPLRPSSDEQTSACSAHHRRYAAQGDRRGWTLTTLVGEGARDMLGLVLGQALRRAEERGQRFAPEPPPLVGVAGTRVSEPWGAAVFTAREGDTVLGAALVGWANRRAYYISGGSTPAGYSSHSSVWLHLSIMAELAASGAELYNLGGTPASAERPDDPEHGLYRFKTGFGAEIVRCCGAQHTLHALHGRTHRLVAEIMGGGAPT